MKKILYVVLDGLGDQPIKELGNKTPLEAALTPHMDRLAQTGITGLMYTVGEGIAPESDIAVISLLGYDAHKYYTGRGPLESFAEGIEVKDGDIAFRVNFATVADDGVTIKDRRVGRNLSTQEATALAKEINANVNLTDATFEFKNTIGHRGVLVIRSKNGNLSAGISNTDPAYEKQGFFGIAKEKFQMRLKEAQVVAEAGDSSSAQEAARLINEFTKKSNEVLNKSFVNKKRIQDGKLSANVILSRDAGNRLPKFPPVSEEYKVKFGSFVEMPVERGIALLTGIDIVEVPSQTGHLDVDYGIWAKIAYERINEFDGLYIHIKGPDEPAHDGDYAKKKKSIEAIDKFFFGQLLKKKNDLSNVLIAVTADHSTVCKIKAHSADPVPLLISASGIKPEGALSFSEKACSKGSLGTLLGKDLMGLLVKLAKE
ncbi:MAG: 2,3-bisphosphoglycerate-independent phosphoglycerate mutase [Candidatus Omnitrophica bacterium]|nr:2,3-bisphosphoglycerate-independent phosphoglycerate mutase [Candidatus Omnitrophota bacterium]